jgi:hypothetical protein
MFDALVTPQLFANLLIVSFFAIEALRWRGERPPRVAADRGTTVVFRSCYVLALLELNTTILSPIMAAPQVVWMGIFGATCSLGALMAAVIATKKRLAGMPHVEGGRRSADRCAHVVFWIGATTASGNVIAALTVTVAMLAATTVCLYDEAAASNAPPSARASL